MPPSARKYNSLNSADLYQAGRVLGSQEEGVDLYEPPRIGRDSRVERSRALCGSQHSLTDCWEIDQVLFGVSAWEKLQESTTGTCHPVLGSAMLRFYSPNLHIGTVHSGSEQVPHHHLNQRNVYTAWDEKKGVRTDALG